MQCSKYNHSMARTPEVAMLMKLEVNGHASRIASVTDLRRNLASFASQHFREIWLSMDGGGPSLSALMNTNVGWLMYLRHDDGDTGFSSRNPMYNTVFNDLEIIVVSDLISEAEKVTDEWSFLRLLRRMTTDWEDERQKELSTPSLPYSAGRNSWENGSIGQFLEAAAA
jgi:hypothetical protein